MSTLGEAIKEFKGMDADGRTRYLRDLQRESPDKFDTFRKALYQEKRATELALGMENQVAIEDQLGGPVDLEATKGASFGMRYDLGRNPSIMDKFAKLQSKHADTKLATNAFGERQLFFRPPGEESYRLADPKGLDTGDLAELPSFTGEIVGSVVPLLVFKNPSMLFRAATTAGGAIVGRGLDIGIEAARGFETRDWDELATDLGIAGAGAGAGEMIAPGVTSLMNFVGQRGSKNALDEGRRELVALIEADPHLKELGFGQNPEGLLAILRGRFAQFDKHLRLQESEQSQSLVRSLEQLVENNPASVHQAVNQMSDEHLNQLQKNLREHADSRVRGLLSIDTRNLSLDQAGKQIQWGVFDPNKEGSFRTVASAVENRRWQELRELAGDNFEFDLDPLLSVMDELTRTHAAQGQAGPVLASRTLPKEVWDIIHKVRSIDGGKIGKTVEVTEKVNTGVLDEAGNPIFQEKPLGEFDGFEFLKTLREDLGGFFGHQNVLNDRDEATARKLWGAFKEVMENPVGGPEGEVFARALHRANRATAFKHEVLEINSMLRLAKSDNPASILSSVESGSLGFSQLQLLKRTMPVERWDAFKTYMKQDMVEHPDRISNLLDKGLGRDPKRLHLFFTPDEVTSLRNYAAQVKEIDDNVFAKTLRRQEDEAMRAYEIFKNASPAEMRQLVAFGGEDAKNEMKAAVLEAIMRNSLRDEFMQTTFDPAVVTRNMDKLFGDKAMKHKLEAFLTPAEIQFLRDRNKYASYISGKGFSKGGAGIAAGAVGGEATDITSPMKMVGALLTARSIGLMSRAMNSPKVLAYMNQSADPFSPNTWLRTASVLATGLAARESKKASDEGGGW